jgi:hypothetical protein
MREAPVGSVASAQGTGNGDSLAKKAFGNLRVFGVSVAIRENSMSQLTVLP